jgi:hypothetical protein
MSFSLSAPSWFSLVLKNSLAWLIIFLLWLIDCRQVHLQPTISSHLTGFLWYLDFIIFQIYPKHIQNMSYMSLLKVLYFF